MRSRKLASFALASAFLVSTNGWLRACNGLMRLEMVSFVVVLYNVFLNSTSLTFFTRHVAVILDSSAFPPHLLIEQWARLNLHAAKLAAVE